MFPLLRTLLGPVPRFSIELFASSMFSFFKVYFRYSSLSDVQFINVFSHSVACHYVRINGVLCCAAVFPFHEVPFITVFGSCAISVQKVSSCADEFKMMPHFLLSQLPCIRLYVEVSDPVGVEFCVQGG